ncbi:phosphate/phosphite/phosphonate ABC transporter substrate-binding protein [Halotia branconii]|uniref:Phosphate/phosphite/phosphonate ABC transporter substrate-binding protein n=1 Tax=Halotia branconii CENA392 TaxID=1539056 RepID=A0AAJ6P9J2_9CYAN|nr:phosphate/phosphite/phosphonate ABC transporter substrate-binding protein [Halotia branconii]WGV25800.1 phosphate/phosphite/phosphonate ABC transporter substrate-binding protein [Halotia branconii CENA392]
MHEQLCHQVVQNILSKKTTLLLSVLAIATLGSACTSNRESSSATLPSATQSPISTTQQSKEEQATITMSVIPWQVSAKQEKKLQPLADYLSKALKRPFKFEIAKDYQTAVNLLVEKKVELAYIGPGSYIEAHQRDPKIEPLVASINQDNKRPWYTSVIVANKASGIKTISDLKGKRFAFVSKLSTSGYIAPMAHLQKLGINPDKYFGSVIMTGSHDKSKQALVKGKVDAIADDRRSYTAQVKEGKIIPTKYNIIWESVPLPSVPIVASSQVSAELKDALKKALIEAPAGLKDPSGAAGVGYTLVQDADYDIIREFQQRVSSK